MTKRTRKYLHGHTLTCDDFGRAQIRTQVASTQFCVCVCVFVCLFCFATCVNLRGLQCKTEHFTRNRSCLRPGYIRSRVRKTTYCSLLITKLLYILSRYLQTLVSYTVKQNLFHSLDIAVMSALDKTRSLTSEKSAVY